MISISSKILTRFVSQVCSAFGISRNNYQPVTIETAKAVTTIRASNGDTSIACHVASGQGQSKFTVALRDLATIKSPGRDIEFRMVRDKVRIDAWQSGEQQSQLCDTLVTPSPVPEASWKLSNPRSLGQVLRHAAELTDPESRRFTLGCLRLRGNDGQIAATNGRQAFTHWGFNFPVDEVLVPAAALAKLNFLDKCTTISVGRSEQWVTVTCSVGCVRWTVDLKIFQKGRFPSVDQCMQRLNSSRCCISLADRDAQYLLTNLEAMLGNSNEAETLTLETASQPGSPITLRFLAQGAKALQRLGAESYQVRAAQPILTELELSGSTSDTTAMRIVVNYKHLLSALRLGYREIFVQSEMFPVFCLGPKSQYVFMPNHPDGSHQCEPGMVELATQRELVAAS